MLTTKQVQEMLKVDRITIYRMLNDGRLKGVKIGNHWRFHKKDIDRLTGKLDAISGEETGEAALTEFPSGCVEKVEDLLAGILNIGVTTTDLDGQPLTELVNSNPFCRLIQASMSGRRACQAAWRQPTPSAEDHPHFQVCHAGLCFFRSPVLLEELPVAWIISGQYRIAPPDSAAVTHTVAALAAQHRITANDLREASKQVPVLSRERQLQVEQWTPRLARTVQSILQERNHLTKRLRQIAEISTAQPAPVGRV